MNCTRREPLGRSIDLFLKFETLWFSLKASDFPSSVAAGYCGGRALIALRRDKSTEQVGIVDLTASSRRETRIGNDSGTTSR